jgi:hypothetical protein
MISNINTDFCHLHARGLAQSRPQREQVQTLTWLQKRKRSEPQGAKLAMSKQKQRKNLLLPLLSRALAGEGHQAAVTEYHGSPACCSACSTITGSKTSRHRRYMAAALLDSLFGSA